MKRILMRNIEIIEWTLALVLIFAGIMIPGGNVAAKVENTDDEYIVIDDGDEHPVGGYEVGEVHYVDEDVELSGSSKELKCVRNVINASQDDVFIKGAGTVGYRALDSEAKRTMYQRFSQAAVDFMESEEDLSPTTMNNDNKDVVYVIAKLKYSDLNLDSNAAFQVFYAFDYDHPGYYWLNNSLWHTSDYIYLSTMEEYAKVSVRETINNKIASGVAEYKTLTDKTDDVLDKIAIVHDKIVTDVDYAYIDGTTTPQTAKWAHRVQGVFDGHAAVVCEGYADTFSLIMNYLDIPNYYIVGTAGSGGAGGGGSHAWNAVSADGGRSYMYMDLTWDDLGERGYYYYYFGTPQSDFESSHFAYTSSGTSSKWLYDLPDTLCDSVEDTYYYRGGYYCSGADDVSEFSKTTTVKTARFGKRFSYLTDDETTRANVAKALGLSSYSYYSKTYKNTPYYIVLKEITSEIDISEAELILENDTYQYTGNRIEPELIVTCNGVQLIEDLNYTVSYAANMEVGEATVTVTGIGNFTGTCTASFTISGLVLTNDDVTLSNTSFTYNGITQIPEVTVTYEGTTLTKNDYEVSYSDDTVNAGTVTVTVKGIGEYVGTVYKTYTISPVDLSSTGMTLSSSKYTYDGTVKEPEVIITYNGMTLVVNTDYIVDYKNNINVGDNASVTVTAAENGNYSGSITETFTIGKGLIAGNAPKADMSVSYSVKTIGDIILNGGWKWNEEDTASALEVGEEVKAVAEYTRADKEYYETNSIEVTVLRLACDHADMHRTALVAATCETDGNIEYWYCDVCEKYFEDASGNTEIDKDELVTSALGHSYGAPVYTWDTTGKTCTATKKCTRAGCTSKIVETVNSVSKVTRQATYTAKGETTYTAYFTNAAFSTQTKVMEDIPMIESAAEPTVEKKTEETTKSATEETTGQTTETATEQTTGQTTASASVGEKLPSGTTGATYTVTSNQSGVAEVEYTQSSGKDKTVTIPATVTSNGVTYKVTSVKAGAFKNNKNVKTVKIGSNVEIIGSNAFNGCKNLTSITIGSNVTRIGDGAFSGCTSIKTITVPAKVTKLGKNVFKGDKKLKTINIKTTKLTDKTVSKNAFKGVGNKVTIKVPKAKKKTYIKLFRKRGLGKKVKVK